MPPKKRLTFKPKARKGTLVSSMEKGVSGYLRGSMGKGLNFDENPPPRKKKKK